MITKWYTVQPNPNCLVFVHQQFIALKQNLVQVKDWTTLNYYKRNVFVSFFFSFLCILNFFYHPFFSKLRKHVRQVVFLSVSINKCHLLEKFGQYLYSFFLPTTPPYLQVCGGITVVTILLLFFCENKKRRQAEMLE